MSARDSILIVRLLETPEEISATEGLQRDVWGGGEVPAHVLVTAAHNGGLVAGAFVGGQLVGFVWGFLGWDQRTTPPRLKHCSHMLGVLPAYRAQGIGEALKRFQYEYVRNQGLPLITWTYDPLLATNAQLNIAKLHAVCNTYIRDAYGGLADSLNQGLATDRFQVDWWVDPMPFVPDPDSAVRYEIPAHFMALHRADPARALTVRLESRDVFEDLFHQGYTVTGFERAADRVWYVLHKRKEESNDAH